MSTLKLLLVDDHIVVREGVGRLLARSPGISVSEVATGREAIAAYRGESFDVVLLDLNLDGMGGLEVLKRLLIDDAKVKVIVFSMHSEPVYAARALKLGAKGYVSKSASSDELLTAIQRVNSGGHYIETQIASEIAIGQFSGEDPLDQLTTREIEILRMLGGGKNMTAIAEAMGVSYKTIANSCSLMRNKLGLNQTTDLIRFSMRHLQD